MHAVDVDLNSNEHSSSIHLANCFSYSGIKVVFFLLISHRFHEVDSGILYFTAILQIKAELNSISVDASDRLLSDHHLIIHFLLVFPFPFLNIRIQKTCP